MQRYFGLDDKTLADAIASARVARVTLDAFLLARGLIAETELYRGLAEALGVQFINHPFRLTSGYPFEMLLSSGIARFEDGQGATSVIAAPRGVFFEDLLMRVFTAEKAPQSYLQPHQILSDPCSRNMEKRKPIEMSVVLVNLCRNFLRQI